MTNAWANIMIVVAVLIFLGILIHGAQSFRPHRARNVKYAEHHPDLVPYVVKVQKYHPEIVKTSRLDRHRFFIIPHAGVFGYSISVLCGAPLTSNVLTLGDQARYTMASCFFMGSLLVLIGSAMGMTIGRWTFKKDVVNHPTAAALGDDVTFPYRLCIAGMGAMLVSSSIYAWTSFQSTFGSLGGWLTAAIAAACALSIPWFYQSIETFQRWDDVLITEAQARLDCRGEESCS